MNTDTYQNSESAAIDSDDRATQPRTAMNFPGTNSLHLNEDAIMAALQSVLPVLVGARITSMSWNGYTSRTLDINFTTDPEPPALAGD